MKKISAFAELIRLSHTLFALPFALLCFFILSKNNFKIDKFILIILTMFFARTAAMIYNRLLDYDIDEKNQRTKYRKKIIDNISKQNLFFLLIFFSICYFISVFFINQLCFYLSSLALFILLFYSHTKRFTIYTHFWLGLCLALAPIGTGLALRPQLLGNPIAFIIGAIVFFWVSGFDIIYSILDVAFDKNNNLFSIPVNFGKNNSMKIAFSMHFIMFILWISMAFYLKTHLFYYIFIFICFIFWLNNIIKTYNKKTFENFFNLNLYFGPLFLAVTLLEVYL